MECKPTMTPMPTEPIEAKPYRAGDAALIPVTEADPFGFWLRDLEASAKGLTSYYAGSRLVAVSFYMPMWDGVVESCALIDRAAASGSGRQLARVMRQVTDRIMIEQKIHRVQATSEVQDRASQVFLRAIGYRLESTMKQGAPDRGDLLVYALLGD